MRVERTDRGQLGTLQRTGSGAARVPAQLTRVGVLEYSDATGSWGELRLPSEVFDPESLASLASCPVTDLHPAEMVSADNWSRLARGHVGDDVRAAGDWVAATLTISHADMIRAIEARERVEISLGYRCELELNPGVYLGTPYKFVQRKIRYNHAGLGPSNWARAGRGARLQLDSVRTGRAAAACARFDGAYHMRFKTLSVDPAGVATFDGRTFDLSDKAQIAACREAVLGHMRSAVPRLDAVEAAQVQPLVDELSGMAAGMTETIMALGAMLAEAPAMPETAEDAEEMLAPEVLDSVAERRGALVARAKSIAPAIETKGKTAIAIMRETLDAAGHKLPERATDDYIRGAFGHLPAAGTWSREDEAVVHSGAPEGASDLVAKARADARKARGEQWKRKPAA